MSMYRNCSFVARPAACWLLLAIVPVLSQAQDMRNLVEAALDEQLTQRIEISDVPLPEALEQLGQHTGLRFKIDKLALDWMPYGEQTRVSIVLDDISVRQGLRRLFDGLGLTMRVEGDEVAVIPSPALERLGRRLTIAEVGLLQRLATAKWDQIQEKVPVEFAMPIDVDTDTIANTQGRNAIEQLDHLTEQRGWLWIPNSSGIVVFDRSADIAARLDRPIDVHFRRIPLDQMLMNLGRQMGITISFEPGALQRVSAAERRVDLIQRGISGRQVLELVCGNTGLWYEVTEDGIMVGADPAANASDSSSASRPRIVAILRVTVDEDTQLDFLIREDELPPEFAAFRERKMPEVIEVLRERLEQP